MVKNGPIMTDPWGRSCYRFAFYHLASLMAVWFTLRMILLIQFAPEILFTPPDLGRVLLAGLHRDAFTAMVLLLPVLMWFWIVPFRFVSTGFYRSVFWTAAFVV